MGSTIISRCTPAPDGFRYRWIRAESVGFQDTKNITGRLREGYELVRAEEIENASDYPVVEDGKYKGVVGVGGLLLAKVPVEIAKQRQEYMSNRHKERDEAVNNDLMKEQDQRMPINVERQSRVTFGGTKKNNFKFIDTINNLYWRPVTTGTLRRKRLWLIETARVRTC